ncbi:MAG: TIGR00159 family protein [Dehalococcoidia bacterium]|nr:TIGR00159 family protein [Dehalococcoidia bacterium]
MPDFDHLRDILEQFEPSSAVDVLLIAVAIFSTLRLLSGTRAMTQLRGALGIILVVVVLGRIFDLTVVNFIVEHSLTAALVAAAVIFQPELRRALDRLGRTGLGGWAKGGANRAVVDALVTAAGRMSREHHGGLFVIERGTGLQDVIDTGIPVDARVSPELLAGIFYPNSPLHDMAVVLRNERVVAAGCVLPLANELPAHERNLGTRHRAAIGITEQTDALSVVVSEETGEISVALAGRLTHVADERRLKAVLEWLLDPSNAGAMSRAEERERVAV